MMASSNEVLDTEPYNRVIFNCSAIAPDGILPDVIYEWFVNDQVLEQDQNGLIKSDQNSLEIFADTAGSFMYTCRAKLELFGGDEDVSASAGTSIEVRGRLACSETHSLGRPGKGGDYELRSFSLELPVC